MQKAKKQNKKNNSKSEEKPEEIVKKIGEENPKKKKHQLEKVKKAVKEGLVEAPAPVAELPVKKNAAKKSKNKKKGLKDADAVEKSIVEEEVNGKTKKAAKAKKEVIENEPGLVKEEKKEQNKLKKKSKKASLKAETADSVLGPEQTVFVGNVPSNTKRVQLLKLFAPCGKVISIRFRTSNGKIIFKHKVRKESAALNAYVAFDSVEAATKALELNGTTLKDQILRVQKTEKTQDPSNHKNTVFVGNLKSSTTDDSLHQIFSSCGEIEYVRTLHSADKEGCNGTAFVCFKSPDAVGLALELKGTMLDERPIHVERYSVKKLGANNKRIAESKTLEKGKSKGGKQKHNGKGNQDKKTEGKSQDEKKKKSEFHGVKSEKKIKKPKKKIPSQMKKLANKIAPKN